ncbi:MAG: hypothetical protein WC142_03260 [Bacteroidales bacterium]|jgi:hypothetical protein|nr:hypothetical protein [Bacteroidales bacterium]MDD2686972.1 hypothetical protein [Bacteroidales bacterium]MDD3330291.1 hypothetical protein [Bacteroidales bacterium]MDD3690977.1 hypothetical protein [Bacteroidales bacterium]MDD4044356.1 hypothetical protein [Bacteroidales bacterium]
MKENIEKTILRINHKPTSDFEGLSPFEMDKLLYDTFGQESPVKLLKLKDETYTNIPILNQMLFFGDILKKEGELKLTNKGYLPTRIVADLYYNGFLKDVIIETGIHKLYKETDSNVVNLTRILAELTLLTKKRNGRLSLTKSGEKLLEDKEKLLKLIFKTFGEKFKWAYYDGYGDNFIGQLGYGFSLYLLSKYGDKKRFNVFYAAKYFKAFPTLLSNMGDYRYNFISSAESCYSTRTFDRFLYYFGLIEMQKEDPILSHKFYLKKTKLFDQLISC